MIILDNYIINEETVLLTGEYDDFGNLWTRVIEGKKTFLVRMSPIQLINKTLLRLGSNFQAARQSSKDLLGEIHMYPIKINATLGIWLFPTKSFNKPDCVWFSLIHIGKTRAVGIRKTEIMLSYGHSFCLGMRENAFNNKRHKAQELRELITRNLRSPLIFYVEPRKGFRIIEGQGRIKKYRIKE